MKKINKKGFTLIELLAVIVILAIVAAVTMTVVVPMLNGKNEEGAITSVKELNKAIANACSSDGVNETYGKFEPGVTDKETCANSTSCTIDLSDDDATTFVRNMNIAGDMPARVNIVVKNCQVQSGCVHYTTGAFKGLKVDISANGTVEASEGTC